MRIRSGVSAVQREIAFDPQTSGGLLVALPAVDAPSALAALRAGGVVVATAVGWVEDAAGGPAVELR